MSVKVSFELSGMNEARRGVRRFSDELRGVGRAAESGLTSRKATQGLTFWDRGISNVTRGAKNLNQRFERLKSSVSGVGLALGGLGAGLAFRSIIRQASDFESALVSVGKTTDIEGRELEKLGDRILEIGGRVPIANQRLLELSAAAGQLGVKGSDNIAAFTETLAKMETATDVVGEEGARSLARLLSITGEGPGVISNLGSAITQLGNNFAATENEIVRTSTFLGSATSQFNLTAAQVTGLSAGLRALGQRAETSGSSIGAAFTEINTALAEGGDKLQTLMDLTGQTADELRESFAKNATSVLLDFSEALSNLPAAEQTEILKQFGLAGRETSRVINAMAGNTELVRNALAQSNEAWKENTALNEEAAKAANTVTSQMQFLGNELNEIIVGADMSPVNEGFKDLRNTLSDPGFQKSLQSIIGAFLKLIEWAGDLVAGLDTLGKALGQLAARNVMEFRNGLNQLIEISRNVFTGIKKWLLDKFRVIVDSIGAQVDRVTGFFRGMWSAVVGNSFVPDMIAGIGQSFSQLNDVMVSPASNAVSSTVSAFSSMTSAIDQLLGTNLSSISRYVSQAGRLFGSIGRLSAAGGMGLASGGASAFTGGGGGFGSLGGASLLGGGGGLTASMQVSNALSSAGLISTQGAQSLAAFQAGLPGEFATASLGGLAAGAGAGFIGNQLAGSLFGKGTGTDVGSGIGGAIGFGVGGPIGSAVGSFIGGGIGGLFNDKDYPFARADIAIRDGKGRIAKMKNLDKGPTGQIRRMAEAVIQGIEGTLDNLGLSPNLNTKIGFASGRPGSKLGKGFFAGGPGSFASGAEFTRLQDAGQAVAAAIEFALGQRGSVRSAMAKQGASIRAFQRGGEAIFTSPSLISVAETGSERVRVGPTSGGQGSSPTIIFEGPNVLDDIGADRLARRVGESLQRRQRRGFRG